MAKLEIQQNWKTRNSTKVEIQQKLENWILNRSGFITKTAKRESYEAVFQEFRCPEEQEFRKAVHGLSFWYSPPRHPTNLEWPFLYTHSIPLLL